MLITQNIVRFAVLISVVSLLISCGALRERSSLSLNTAKLTDSAYVKKVLYSQFNDWQGVRYRYGGLSRSGIDCSGFVYVTFKTN